MAKISQYPTITTLTGQELVLMDSGPPGNRQTVTASTATISQAVAQSIAAGIGLFSATQSGVVPASGGGTSTTLSASGVWTASFTGNWTFGNVLLGPSAVPVYDSASGNVGYYARTAAEITAGVTPTNYSYAPGNVLRYGADQTGAADSTAAFTAAVNSFGPLGGTVVVGPGKFYIASGFTVPVNVTVQGPFVLPGVNSPNNSGYDYSVIGSIRLSSAATITLHSGSGMVGCLIYLQGLSFPQADTSNYAGTAIQFSGDDCFIERCRILGFSTAITSNSFARPRFIDLRIDCTNGINLQNCEDVGVMQDVVCQPIVTVGGGQAGRSGTAFYYNNCDFFTPTRCGEFGYAIGFDVETSSTFTLLECWTDNNNVGTPTSIGVKVNGTCGNFRMNGGILSEQGTSAVINNTAPQVDDSRFIGVEMFGPQQGTCVVVQNGHVTFLGCTFEGATTGIDLTTQADGLGITAIACTFDTVTTDINSAGGSRVASNVHDNFYVSCTAAFGEARFIQNMPILSLVNSFGTGGALQYVFQSARGANGTPAAVQNGDVLFGTFGAGYDGTTYQSVSGVRSQIQGTVTGSSMPTVLVLSACPVGSHATVDEVALSGTAFYPLTDNALTCGANGNRWSAVWAATGTIQTSDARQKTDVTPLALGLNFINQLKPVSYRWKVGGRVVERQVWRNAEGAEVAPGTKEGKPAEIVAKDEPGKRTHLGFLAQDVKSVLGPEDIAVHILADPMDQASEQGLRYEELIAPLVKAVQELGSRVYALESRA